MKTTIILISFFCLIQGYLFAQAPEKMSYQAVIRNATNDLMSNQTVGMKVSLLQGSTTGTIIFSETHTSNTNLNGLVSIEIGAGNILSGDFTTVDWANGPYYVQTEIDLTGGTNYTLTQTTQMMSVPYALYAKTAGAELNQWQYGVGIPTNGLGTVGDFYYDTQNGDIYYKNSGSSWVLTGNIRGP
ncbi:hypothetical protein N9Y29_02045, partial [Crocinitomicaceae bacterium]|nr:hypothetical protein [Crocinitomicaceae bacterium]